METLVFQLQAPLSSWGEPAVGEFRGTAEWASLSALIGLLGAALGLLREDESAHAALRDGLGFAVGLLSGGSLLRDYHTAQVPSRAAMKGRPHATRRHELAVPKSDLSTILSTRDYRQNGACLVAIQARVPTDAPSLPALAAALREPKFLLYLGRNSARQQRRCGRSSLMSIRRPPRLRSTRHASRPRAMRSLIPVAVRRWRRCRP